MNDFLLEGVPRGTRVVVAMSGGVDSSTTAALLKDAGYDVIGVTLQLYDHGAAISRPGACCAGKDIHDARRVAEVLDIPHYVLDFEKRFHDAVIGDFAETYARGETPIPCVRCNETVKFTDLLDRSLDLGAEILVTGHYARWAPGPKMLTGADPKKDQSYFLFSITREQLDRVRFPLGGLDKEATRALAARFDLPVAKKAESQDICFVPEGNYADLVARLHPEAAVPGEIVDADGTVLGEHRGLIHYTVGQRRGMGVSGPEPYYVLRLDMDANRLVVGPKTALSRNRLTLHDVNWLGDGELGEENVTVKLRSTMAPTPARIRALPRGRAEITLDPPQAGVAPGQACVLYSGERVLGGGWIERD